MSMSKLTGCFEGVHSIVQAVSPKTSFREVAGPRTPGMAYREVAAELDLPTMGKTWSGAATEPSAMGNSWSLKEFQMGRMQRAKEMMQAWEQATPKPEEEKAEEEEVAFTPLPGCRQISVSSDLDDWDLPSPLPMMGKTWSVPGHRSMDNEELPMMGKTMSVPEAPRTSGYVSDMVHRMDRKVKEVERQHLLRQTPSAADLSQRLEGKIQELETINRQSQDRLRRLERECSEPERTGRKYAELIEKVTSPRVRSREIKPMPRPASFGLLDNIPELPMGKTWSAPAGPVKRAACEEDTPVSEADDDEYGMTGPTRSSTEEPTQEFPPIREELRMWCESDPAVECNPSQDAAADDAAAAKDDTSQDDSCDASRMSGTDDDTCRMDSGDSRDDDDAAPPTPKETKRRRSLSSASTESPEASTNSQQPDAPSPRSPHPAPRCAPMVPVRGLLSPQVPRHLKSPDVVTRRAFRQPSAVAAQDAQPQPAGDTPARRPLRASPLSGAQTPLVQTLVATHRGAQSPVAMHRGVRPSLSSVPAPLTRRMISAPDAPSAASLGAPYIPCTPKATFRQAQPAWGPGLQHLWPAPRSI